MKRNSSRYLRLFIAVYVALLGIIIPSTADIPTTLVVTAYFDNSPINLVDIPTVSRMMNDVFLESAHRGNPWSYDVSNRYMSQNNPVRSTYPSLYICLDLVHRLEILRTRYHQRRTVLVTWEEGLLATAAHMVTVGQAEVDLAGGIVADIVVLVRIVASGIPTVKQ